MISDRRDFARELSRARELVGLTVRDIATALGVPASTLGGYFGGAHLPKLGSSAGLERILRSVGRRGLVTRYGPWYATSSVPPGRCGSLGGVGSRWAPGRCQASARPTSP
jgi:hypothetical protein